MKKIEAFIKPFKLEDVKAALADIEIEICCIVDAQELSHHRTYADAFRGTAYEMDIMPRTLVLIYAENERVNTIISCIQETASTGHSGDGRIFVSPVEVVVPVDAVELEPQ